MALRRIRMLIRQPAAIELVDRKNYTDGPLAASTNATLGCGCSGPTAIETDRMCRSEHSIGAGFVLQFNLIRGPPDDCFARLRHSWAGRGFRLFCLA